MHMFGFLCVCFVWLRVKKIVVKPLQLQVHSIVLCNDPGAQCIILFNAEQTEIHANENAHT